MFASYRAEPHVSEDACLGVRIQGAWLQETDPGHKGEDEGGAPRRGPRTCGVSQQPRARDRVKNVEQKVPQKEAVSVQFTK